MSTIGFSFAKKLADSLGLSVTRQIVYACTSLASSIISFISSMYLIKTHGAGKYFAFSIPLVSTLTSVVCQIASIVELSAAFTFSRDRAFEVVTMASEHFLNRYDSDHDDPSSTMSNATTTPTLVRYGIQICAMLLTAGMIKYKFSVNDINAYLTLREKTTRASTDAVEFVTEIFSDFGWADLDHRLAKLQDYQTLTTKALALLRYDPANFIIEPGLYNQLLDTCTQIQDILLRKLDRSEYQRYATIRNQLSGCLTKLNEIQATISTLTDAQTRIATVGLILEGPPGIGKSEFANYLMRDVCSALTLPTAIYDLKLGASDKFFNVYVNQAAAIVNEFGATQTGDSSLRHLNSIVSSDPFNFESAFIKSQPCKLRVVTCTSNRTDYTPFLKDLTEQALCAMFSRFTRVEVSDELFTGRQGENPHRRPDFSHLKLLVKKPRNSNFTTMTEFANSVSAELTFADLRKLMLRRCAEAEVRFIESVSTIPNSPLTEAQHAIFRARIDQLAHITSMSILPPLTFSNAINYRAPPPLTTRHCVIRLQGGVGKGKSTTIRVAAVQLSAAYNMPITHIVTPEDLSLYNPTEPHIYIFDDFPIHRHAQRYMEFVNNMHSHSVVFIGTNHVVPLVQPNRVSKFNIANAFFNATSCYEVKGLFNPCSSSFILSMLFKFMIYMWCYAPALAYMPTDDNLHCSIADTPGIMRRIGLDTRIIEGVIPISLQPSTGYCLTSNINGGFDTYSGFLYSDRVPDALIDHYVEYLRESDTTTFIRVEPPPFRPDVTIIIRDFDIWRTMVTSEHGYTQMFLQSNHPAGQVIVEPAYIQHFLTRTSVRYWLMPNITSVADLEGAITTLCVTLRNALPDINVLIQSDERSFGLTRRALYAWGTYQAPDVIEIKDGQVLYDNQPIPPGPIMKFIYHPHSVDIPVVFPGLQPSELASIKRWFCATNDWRAIPVYSIAEKDCKTTVRRMQDIKEHPIISYFRTCSVGAKILTALLVTFATSAIVYGIYKFITHFTSKGSKGNTKSNEDLDSSNTKYDERNGQYQEEYVRGVSSGLYQNPRQYAAVLFNRTGDSTLARSWELYDMDIRSNSAGSKTQLVNKFVEAVRTGNTDHAKRVFADLSKKGITYEDLESMFKTTSNAVNSVSEHTQDNSIINSVMRKMRDAACQILIDNIPVCYGIFFSGNRVLTVGHCFENTTQTNVAIRYTSAYGTPAKEYPARIIALNRDKDIAICQILDKTFPAQKSLENMLPHHTDSYQWNGACYYLRPTQAGYIFQGYATRHAYTTARRIDHNNPNYCPATWYTYNYSQVLKCSDVFKSGDCGFPLIAIENNKPVILGIHNGFDGSGTAYFSPLTITDLQCVIDAPGVTSNYLTPERMVDRIIDGPPKEGDSMFWIGAKDVPAYNAVVGDTMKPDLLWPQYHDALNVMGRTTELYFHSNPVNRKKDMHDSNCRFPNPSLPSPITTRGLPESTIVKLPIDSRYRASPLMAQAIKFADSKTLDIDSEVFHHAVAIQTDMYQFHLGELTLLRPAVAINGVLGEPLKPIVMETSPGPYLKKVYRMDNKRQLFVNVNANDPTKPAWYVFSNHPAAKQLASDMDSIFHAWSNGIHTPVVIKDNPKVELLPREEVLQNGKIRLFCELDLAVNLVIRRLLGDFISKMQDNHMLSNCKTGVNFYRDLHWYAKNFPKDSDVFGFDVRRMDKNLSDFLIHHVFQLVYNLLSDKAKSTAGYAYATCAYSLSNAIHIFEGMVYQTERGNPSGVTGTNQINTVILELIVIYNHVKVCNQIGRPLKTHTSASYYFEVKGFLNGDNGYLAVSKSFGYTQERIQQSFNDFGLEILFDKSKLDGIEWCGRVIKYENGFLIPALRAEAILRQIYYIDNGRKSDIPNQFAVVQFEAALHDKDFFDHVQADIRYMCRKLNLPMDAVHFHSWKDIRAHYVDYILGKTKSPIITEQATEYLLHHLRFDTNRAVIMSTNWVSAYYERCARDKVPIEPTIVFRQDSTTFEWESTVTDQTYSGQGIGVRKPDAKNTSFGVLFENRFGKFTKSNSHVRLPTMHKHTVRYTYDNDVDSDGAVVTIFSDNVDVIKFTVQCTQEEFTKRLQSTLKDPVTYTRAFSDYLVDNTSSNMRRAPAPVCPDIPSRYLERTSHPLVYRVRRELMTPEQLRELDPDYKPPQTTSNSLVGTSDTPSRNPNLNVMGAEDAVSQGVSNQGGSAPQPSTAIGNPSPPQQVIESTGGLAKVTNLNPLGPINMMSQGAIVFDYPALVYSQIMDTDQTYRVTDSMAVGTKVLEIPYDPLSEFINPYARQWVSQHERYNGDILIRINTISNQLFSGALTVFWYSKSYPSEIVSRTEAQKYSYQVISLTMPATEYYVLKDARSYLYYRSTADPVLPDRPILAIAVHLPLRNPQRDGIYADIVIGSRLCSMRDSIYGATPFVVANPILTSTFSPTPVNTLNGQTLGDVFPQFGVNYLRMFTDGTTTVPSYSLLTDGAENYFDLRCNIPAVCGGAFTATSKKRLFAWKYPAGGDSIGRAILVMGQYPESFSTSVSQLLDPVVQSDSWLSEARAGGFVTSQADVYCSRNNGASLIISVADDSQPTVGPLLTLVQQTTFLTNFGVIYVLCMNVEFGTANLGNAFAMGLQDNAQHLPLMLPHNSVLGAILTADRLVPLPAGWKSLKFSKNFPPVVSTNTETAPTVYSDASILSKFDKLSASIGPRQAIQFTLLEPIAQTPVAVVRYLPEQRDFAIYPNTSSKYMLYPDDAATLVISEYGVVRLDSGFPSSDLGDWALRQPAGLATSRYYRNMLPHTTSNAVIVPEAIAEMDAAMSEMGDAVADSTAPSAVQRTAPGFGSSSQYTTVPPYVRSSTASAASGKWMTNEKMMDYLIYGILPLTNSNGSVVTKPFEIYNSDQQNDANRRQQSAMQQSDETFQTGQQQRDEAFQQSQQTSSQTFQQGMQNSAQAFSQAQQQRQFGFQTGMDTLDYQHNTALQAASFANSNRQLASQQAFSKDMEETSFTHGLVNTALGGVFGLADTALGKVGDYFLEGEKFNDQTSLNNQNFNNQSRLMTQNAALNIQSAGQSSQSMLLAQTN